MERRGDYTPKVALPGLGAEPDLALLDPETIAELERRREIILRVEAHGRAPKPVNDEGAREFGCSPRHFQRFRERFRENPHLLSLRAIPPNGGRDGQRLENAIEIIIAETRDEWDEERPEAEDHQIFAEIERVCRERGYKPPCRNTLRARFSGVTQRARDTKKYGSEAVRDRYDPVRGKSPKFTCPLERVQIDHTLVDVVVSSPYDRGHIGRVWITLVIDEYSRAILAFVLSWEAPCTATVAQAIVRMMTPKRDWLTSMGATFDWPFYGKPREIFVDKAQELNSKGLRAGCKAWGIPFPKQRAAKHWGGIIERRIGGTMEKMRLLKGATARSRWLSKGRTVNPNEEAEMTFEELELWLAEYICEQYHVTPHAGAQHQRPDLRWTRGIHGTEKKPGVGAPAIIKDVRKLFLDFCQIRTNLSIERYGVQWGYVRYFDDVLRPFIDNLDQRTFVFRRNPFDVSRIYFKHPKTGVYHELVADRITCPKITAWEVRAAVKRIKAAGDKPDNDRIDASVRRQRAIERNAKDAKGKVTRRRTEARHRQGARINAEMGLSVPAATSPANSAPRPAAPQRRIIAFGVDA